MAIQNNSKTNSSYKLYTGLTTFDVLAFDPTNEEYENKTGNTLPFELSYDANADGVVTHKVLLRETTTNTFMFQDFRIGTPTESKTGKWQWVDKDLNVCWGESPETVKSKYFDPKSAKKAPKGFEDFSVWLRHVMRTPLGADMGVTLTNISQEDITVDKLIKMNKKAINNLIKDSYVVSDDPSKCYPYASITGCVSIYTANSGKMRMVVSPHRDTMGTTEVKDNAALVSSYSKTSIEKKINDSQSTYPIISSSHLFGIEFKEYDVNSVFSNTEEASDLPF